MENNFLEANILPDFYLPQPRVNTVVSVRMARMW
jgi:hypothetical protein